ncbi:hypothetical protein D3C73_599820 [compost metagenome]
MTRNGYAKRGNDADNGCNLKRFAEKGNILFLQQFISTDAGNQESTCSVSGKNRVRKLDQQLSVRNECPNIIHFRTSIIDCKSYRMLHERIGQQNPESRQHGSERYQPDREQVNAFGYLIPAKNPDSNKCRLQKEGKQRFNRQRSPKDVTDKTRVVRPVHPELKLLQNSCHYAHSEVNQEKLSPELRHSFVLIIAFSDIHRLHDCNQERESN